MLELEQHFSTAAYPHPVSSDQSTPAFEDFSVPSLLAGEGFTVQS